MSVILHPSLPYSRNPTQTVDVEIQNLLRCATLVSPLYQEPTSGECRLTKVS